MKTHLLALILLATPLAASGTALADGCPTVDGVLDACPTTGAEVRLVCSLDVGCVILRASVGCSALLAPEAVASCGVTVTPCTADGACLDGCSLLVRVMDCPSPLREIFCYPTLTGYWSIHPNGEVRPECAPV